MDFHFLHHLTGDCGEYSWLTPLWLHASMCYSTVAGAARGALATIRGWLS